MKRKILLLSLVLTSLFVGCYKNDTETITENKLNNVQIIENYSDLKNIIINKNEVNINDNSNSIVNLDLRNKSIVDKYSESINLIENFSVNNSLKLTFAEPIKHRISRMANVGNRQNLLQDLQSSGAETVSYFTDEDVLNVELSIIEHDETYSHIVYKSSLMNIDENFNFKESKLNEFRNILIEKNELDFDKINKYITDATNNLLDVNTVFFNKIDDNLYETISIANNNCYYKLIYNPKL